ncbi:YdeI/OmpD-associated family protein [Algoriphagus resistens]|uniref:YdeI/OmpD-associated family protein n=1 Tax=Algoriphagus resistens TaxID=1750590 RepID=UPI000716B0C0|nr:YdeI/OmpD-associated family protein [Algoriphagus resistens]
MKFEAEIKIIGLNPYASVPKKILDEIFQQAGSDKSPIPIRGRINGADYQQTLMKHLGEWRLYINTNMLQKSPERIGELVQLTVEYDPSDRSITPHPKLVEALGNNQEAKKIFDGLTPSLRKEIVRYISSLKSEESISKNVERAIGFLLGNNRFIGRDKL